MSAMLDYLRGAAGPAKAISRGVDPRPQRSFKLTQNIVNRGKAQRQSSLLAERAARRKRELEIEQARIERAALKRKAREDIERIRQKDRARSKGIVVEGDRHWTISISDKKFQRRKDAIRYGRSLDKPFKLFRVGRDGVARESDITKSPSKKAVKREKRLKTKLGTGRPCLEFSSYQKYLESALWKSIRRKVLARDDGLCLVCGARANQVHHRSYREEVLRGHALEQLMTICRPCHEKIHFTSDGAKRSLAKTNSMADKLVTGRPRGIMSGAGDNTKGPQLVAASPA